MAGLLPIIVPLIVLPGVLVGEGTEKDTQPVQMAQLIAFSILIVSFVFLLFTKSPWLCLIPGVASAAYWGMMKDPEHTKMYRYGDWLLTSPMILIAILIANGASVFSMIGIVVLDLIMIVAGYYGSVSTNEQHKIALFTVGCLVFLPILYTLFKMTKSKYAVYLTLVLWTLYPIVGYADEEKMISHNTGNIVYSVMDTIAKVGMVNLIQL